MVPEYDRALISLKNNTNINSDGWEDARKFDAANPGPDVIDLSMGMMPLNNLHPCYIFVPIIAMAILWGEYYIFAQDTDTRMKLLKYQFLVILEVIMSCLSALLIKFSQNKKL